mmetsp:Transcript_8679/g.25666  ORF Transcript_8679/g.25666 Transcript_8679/m.25666 type:complete len:216 (+) Transcript_8679:616-1263(+)
MAGESTPPKTFHNHRDRVAAADGQTRSETTSTTPRRMIRGSICRPFWTLPRRLPPNSKRSSITFGNCRPRSNPRPQKQQQQQQQQQQQPIQGRALCKRSSRGSDREPTTSIGRTKREPARNDRTTEPANRQPPAEPTTTITITITTTTQRSVCASTGSTTTTTKHRVPEQAPEYTRIGERCCAVPTRSLTDGKRGFSARQLRRQNKHKRKHKRKR